MGKRFGLAFGLAIALVIINAIISYRSTDTLIANNGWVLHTEEVIAELSETLSNVKDAETGQRGYIITRDERYLEPYTKAAGSLDGHLARLRELIKDNHEQEQRLKVLEEKIRTRMQTLKDNLGLRRDKDFDVIREAGMLDRGLIQMNAVRDQIAEMTASERKLLDVRLEEAKNSGRNTILTFIISNLLFLAFFVLVFYLVKRYFTERLRSENALREANDQLENRVQERTAELGKTNLELQRSNRELQDFAFVASHDLQEPLRKIQAFGDRLRMKFGEKLGEEGVDHLSRMQNAAKRMQTLINDLLTFSRVTTKAQPFVQVDLEKTAREVLEDLETRIQQTGGRVELSELPEIDADPLQMRQLLQNLIGNALKFHRPEIAPVVTVNGKIISGDEQVNSASKNFCRLEIEDNGIGFDEKYLDRIFTPFQRLHARTEYEGTGMGLAVCRKIVERHGGEITATSTPGTGTKFIVTLPVRQNEGA